MTHAHDPETLSLHLEWAQRLARRLLSDSHAAEDLVQDTWVAALGSPPPSPWDPRRWLGGVMRNMARTHRLRAVRRGDRERASARAERVESSSGVHERAEAHQRLVDAVMTLGEPYRDVVLLRYFDAMPTAAIATELELEPSTVRTRLQRGLEQLRESLGRRPDGEGPLWTLGATVGTAPSSAKASGWFGLSLGVGVASLALLAGLAWRNWESAGSGFGATEVAGIAEVVLESSGSAGPMAHAQGLSPEDPPPNERTPLKAISPGPGPPTPSKEEIRHSIGPVEEVARIRVVNLDGTYAAGARVRYRHASEAPMPHFAAGESWAEGFPHAALADAKGVAEIPWVNETITTLVIEEGFLGTAQIESRYDPKRPLGRIELKPDGPLEVEVVDSRGKTVPGAWVYMGFQAERTDDRGIAVFEHVKAAMHGGGHVPLHLGILSPDVPEDELFTILETWPVGGRVQVIHPPVGFVHLQCMEGENWEEALILTHPFLPEATGERIRGGEAIIKVAAGLSTVQIHVARGVLGPVANLTTPGPSEGETVNVTVIADPKPLPRWVFRAIDAGGEPIANGVLHTSTRSETRNMSTVVKTDDLGRFVLGLPEGRTLDASPLVLEVTRGRGSNLTSARTELSRLSAASDSIEDLVFESRAALVGRVLDPMGRSVPGLRLSVSFIQPENGTGTSRHATHSLAPLGDFSVVGPIHAEEKIRLRLGAKGFQNAEYVLEPTQDAQLVLQPEATFRAEVLLDESVDREALQWTLSGPDGSRTRYDGVPHDGISTLRVAPGTYTLTLVDRDSGAVLRRIENIKLSPGNPEPDPRLHPLDLRQDN